MDSGQLITAVRINAALPAAHPVYTDARLYLELTDACRSIFVDLMTIPREGHWQKSYTFQSAVGQTNHRVTYRAIIGGVEKVEIGDIGQGLYALDEVTENHAQLYEGFNGRTGTPAYYVIRGDQITFLPAFDRPMNVRITYYVRPSRFVEPRSHFPTAPVQGRITSFNTTNRTVTVTAIPVDFDPFNGTATITSGDQLVDIVHPNGNYELAVVGASQTYVSTTITLGVGTDTSQIQVGDFVRCADQSEWPPLPEEFHRLVADVAAVKILLALNQAGKAQQLASSAQGDVERLRLLINTPRTRRQPKRMRARLQTRGVGVFNRFWRS